MRTVTMHPDRKVAIYTKQPEPISGISLSPEPVVKAAASPETFTVFAPATVNMINGKKLFMCVSAARTFITVGGKYLSLNIGFRLPVPLTRTFGVLSPALSAVGQKFLGMFFVIPSHVCNAISRVFVGHKVNPPRIKLSGFDNFVKLYFSAGGSYNLLSLKEI